jgi:hypothetical protein
MTDWATGKMPGKVILRPGEWICAKCNKPNDGKNKVCKRCGKKR